VKIKIASTVSLVLLS